MRKQIQAAVLALAAALRGAGLAKVPLP